MRASFFLLGVLLLVAGNVQAKDYTFHTVFVYNFTKYIEWPSKGGSEVVIGISGGNSEVVAAFQKMAESKSSSERKYVVKVVNSVADAGNCHVVFVPESDSDKAAGYSQTFGKNGLLVVTEKDGYVKKGGMINFITVDGKIRFELNRAAIDKTGLKVSSQLLSLAIVV